MKGSYADGCSAPDFILARNDRELVSAMPKNIEAGYFRADCTPKIFYDKCTQYTAIKMLAPELAFNGKCVGTLTDLPLEIGLCIQLVDLGV
ncbi:hypothetical protein PSI15_02050 [Xenorhabdus sp. PR6a]|uniref:hypothetical protein n=1 Tax=Xenorhabdus sp. PR6a TaxID=3025877 RepID=UPI0023594045|nr:hypothetical protein [Xenorhabdus sp. PR6a]MDC9580365.1 hypothetical protein [Xenorhabdus sp. PR6a]